MDSKNELLLSIKEMRKNLKSDTDFCVKEMMNILEGITPFLDKETITRIKCSGCDNYAASFFPLSEDYWAVENSEYCHAKKLSLKNIKLMKLASCNEFSMKAQENTDDLVNHILEEDVKPFIANKKLYDRKFFTSFPLAFRVGHKPGKVCIEFGHMIDKIFEPFDATIHLVRRLDPGFGPEDSKKIAEVLKTGPAVVAKCGQQSRSMLDLDRILKGISEKRKIGTVNIQVI
jgi:hypothetical protein